MPREERRRSNTRRRGSWGQSVVELALLLPIVTMLVLGTVDLGRAYYFYSAVANATRVGAQYALDPQIGTAPGGQTEIKRAIIDEASPYVPLTEDRITFTTANWASDYDLTVRVTYDFHFLTPGAASLWGDPLTMSYESTVRFE
ncbi:MAG: TadE/TadG family type IV pilus assembly protein [Chloroflexota bacterium]